MGFSLMNLCSIWLKQFARNVEMFGNLMLASSQNIAIIVQVQHGHNLGGRNEKS